MEPYSENPKGAAGVIGFIRQAVAAAVELDEALTEIRAITPGHEDKMTQIVAAARALSCESGYTEVGHLEELCSEIRKGTPFEETRIGRLIKGGDHESTV